MTPRARPLLVPEESHSESEGRSSFIGPMGGYGIKTAMGMILVLLETEDISNERV